MILVFEYATAQGLNDPELLIEGKAMLEAILKDLDGLDACYLISENIGEIRKFKTIRPLFLKKNESIYDWLEKNISNFNSCFFVAPESDMELYKLTKLIEDSGIKIIGSNSDAVLKCSDKWLTYKSLKNKVNVIETYKVKNYKKEKIDGKLVLKPRDGVSCQNIKILDSIEELSLKKIDNEKYLLQKFIEGKHVSVSLLSNGKIAVPISLNRQYISIKNGKMRYLGGLVPYKHPNAKSIMKTAKNAVESIDGIKGYVGVDLVVSDRVYVVEINSRVTTPYIALRELVNFNLGEAIINSVEGILPSEVSINAKSCIEFKKEDKDLKLVRIDENCGI